MVVGNWSRSLQQLAAGMSFTDSGIRERPGTALAFAGQRILDGSIGFEHLHTKLTEHIDNNSCIQYAGHL